MSMMTVIPVTETSAMVILYSQSGELICENFYDDCLASKRKSRVIDELQSFHICNELSGEHQKEKVTSDR